MILEKELYRLNKADKSGKCATLKVEVYGGVHETNMIEDEIYAQYPHLNTNNFKQQSLAYVASYYYVLDGDFAFSDGKSDYVLKQNFKLSDTNLKPICQGESGYTMNKLFFHIQLHFEPANILIMYKI